MKTIAETTGMTQNTDYKITPASNLANFEKIGLIGDDPQHGFFHVEYNMSFLNTYQQEVAAQCDHIRKMKNKEKELTNIQLITMYEKECLSDLKSIRTTRRDLAILYPEVQISTSLKMIKKRFVGLALAFLGGVAATATTVATYFNPGNANVIDKIDHMEIITEKEKHLFQALNATM